MTTPTMVKLIRAVWQSCQYQSENFAGWEAYGVYRACG